MDNIPQIQCRHKNCERTATIAMFVCVHTTEDKSIGQMPPLCFCQEHYEKFAALPLREFLHLEERSKEFKEMHGIELSYEHSHIIPTEITDENRASLVAMIRMEEAVKTLAGIVKNTSPSKLPISVN